MPSDFVYPKMTASEIAGALTKSGIATVSVEDIATPTADLACALYSSILNFFQPLRDDIIEQVDFGALPVNPEHHEDAINIINLSHRVKELLASIDCNSFRLSDLLRPQPKRTILFLSAIINFIYYREEKLADIQLVMDKVPACDERRSELEERLAELEKQSTNYKVAREMEESLVHEVETEVNKLKQSIQDYNKQQVQMRNQAKELKDKTDAIDGKISQIDFELLKKAEENSKLLSEVVQSPERLQVVREEKRKKLAEAKNSERVSIQHVKEKSATLEVYMKVFEKMSKLSSKLQVTQEQINSAKNVEKEVKALKVKLSEDSISNMAVEARLFELKGKAKQAEELLRAAERECNDRQSEDANKLNGVRAEVDYMLKLFETREMKIEDLVARSDSLRLAVDSVREAEKLKQQELLSKLEELVLAFCGYSNRTTTSLQNFLAKVDSEDSKGAPDNMPST